MDRSGQWQVMDLELMRVDFNHVCVIAQTTLHTFNIYNNNNNTTLFRRRGSQVARVTRSYDRLHRFFRIVLCNICHPVLFSAFRRKLSISALVFRRMTICSRSHISTVLSAHNHYALAEMFITTSRKYLLNTQNGFFWGKE